MQKSKKKLIILFIVIIIAVLSLFLVKNSNETNNENIFKDIDNYIEDNYSDYLSYSEINSDANQKDIVSFINYCKDNSIDYHKNKQIIDFYKLTDFKPTNSDRYIVYLNAHTNSSYEKIIQIVNNNLDDIILNNPDYQLEDFVLSLSNEKYYIKENLTRYANYYMNTKNPNITIKDVIIEVNSNLDYGFYENCEATDISKDTLMIVNKHYQISENYTPENLVTVESEHGYPNRIRADAYEEFKKMYEAAKKDNVSIFIASPYRSYYDQKGLYDYYVSTDGEKNADTYSARPGSSEHHTGLAMDLIPEYGLDLDTFEYSAGFKWMQDNAHKFGFILRYPKGKEYITGYIYEPWHYRYVGTEAANTIKNENLTFEEYYEYYIK